MEEYYSLEWFKLHPPSCIDGLGIEPGPDFKNMAEKYRANGWTAFEIVCKCGHPTFRVRAQLETAPAGYSFYHEPLIAICDGGCGEQILLFDGNRDGWEAAHGLHYRSRDKEPVEINCGKCGAQTNQLLMAFEVPEDLSFDDPTTRPQDCYCSCNVEARCMRCGEIRNVISDECA